MTLEEKIKQQVAKVNANMEIRLSELEQQATEQAIETDYQISLLRLGL